MKLMKDDKYRTCVAFGVAGLTIINLIIIKGEIKKNEKAYEEPIKVVEFEEKERIKTDFRFPSIEDKADTINDLNIEEKSLPYKSYKIIEFKDNEGYYRIMPVVSKLGYEINYDGEIIGEYYDVCDAFSDIPLFKMNNSKEKTEAYNDLFNGAKIISYKDFSNIRNIAYLHGAPYEFIDCVMPLCGEYDLLSNTDIAIAYSYLISENYRVIYDDLVNKDLCR